MAMELGRQTETSVVNQPITDNDLATPWDEIELAESYLVCAMFKEAASVASCVLKRLRDKEEFTHVDIELNDMLESAGMVLVQSLKELGRTQEIMKELSQLYTSLSAIPLQVFLAGACFQMQQDPRGAQQILEEFLSKWKFVNGQYYVLETNTSYTEVNGQNRFILEVNAYLEVVEAYITLVTGILKATDLAISWVEKAALPDDIRQKLLRRLHSMNDASSQASTSALLTDGNVTSISIKKGQLDGDQDDAAKQAILRYSGQHVSTFWWFRKVTLKVGGLRLAVSNGNILLTALMLLAYYYMRRKKYTITSILKGQAQFLKKTAIDLWQLAFSYQVNPLASVESLQTPSRLRR